MVTKIYVLSAASSDITALNEDNLTIVTATTSAIMLALKNQSARYNDVIEVCKEARENSIIVFPELCLHINLQQTLVDDINKAVGNKPLRLLVNSATVFFPHHKHLVERL